MEKILNNLKTNITHLWRRADDRTERLSSENRGKKIFYDAQRFHV